VGALHPPARPVYGVRLAVMEAPQTRAGRRGLRLGSSRLGIACLKSMTQELHIGARVTNRAVERQSDSESELKPLRVFVILLNGTGFWSDHSGAARLHMTQRCGTVARHS
jgi:hypothetical protein